MCTKVKWNGISRAINVYTRRDRGWASGDHSCCARATERNCLAASCRIGWTIAPEVIRGVLVSRLGIAVAIVSGEGGEAGDQHHEQDDIIAREMAERDLPHWVSRVDLALLWFADGSGCCMRGFAIRAETVQPLSSSWHGRSCWIARCGVALICSRFIGLCWS